MKLKIFGISLCIAAIGLIIYANINLMLKFKNESKILQNAFEIPQSDEVDVTYEDELAYEGFGLYDDVLEIPFLTRYILRREVEYCQWQEIKKEDGSYEYKQDWSKSYIPSKTFKKQEGHVNVNRTGLIANRTVTMKYALVNGYKVDTDLIKSVKENEYQYIPDDDQLTLNSISNEAQKEGFNYLTSDWIYSKYNERSQYVDHHPFFLKENHLIIQKLKNNCSNGDVRVRFFTVGFPLAFTIVAQAKGDTLIPYKVENDNNDNNNNKEKSYFWVYKNINSIENIIHNVREDSNRLLYTLIGISVGLMFVGNLFIGKYKYAPFRVAPTFFRALLFSPACAFGITFVFSCYVYGFDDLYTGILLVMSILPLLLIFLINKFCTYKYILDYVKKQH